MEGEWKSSLEGEQESYHNQYHKAVDPQGNQWRFVAIHRIIRVNFNCINLFTANESNPWEHDCCMMVQRSIQLRSTFFFKKPLKHILSHYQPLYCIKYPLGSVCFLRDGIGMRQSTYSPKLHELCVSKSDTGLSIWQTPKIECVDLA